MTRTTTAMTSKRWIRPPAMWKLKPRSHRTKRITKTVQSMSTSLAWLRKLDVRFRHPTGTGRHIAHAAVSVPRESHVFRMSLPRHLSMVNTEHITVGDAPMANQEDYRAGN